MIYNEGLTNDLVEIFGTDVLNWTNAKIRNELEAQVVKVHNVAMMGSSKDIRSTSFEIFRELKNIDDAFTELYTNELEYKV